MTVFIGINGKKGSGKSEFAQACEKLLRREKRPVQMEKFAGPLHDFVRRTFQCNTEDPRLKEVPLPVIGASPRKLLQTLGTEWGRDMIHPDIWVQALRLRLARLPESSVIIDDVRFPNEAMWIRDSGGMVITIARHTGKRDTHPSEAGIPKELIDLVLHNNGTLDQLRRAANVVISQGTTNSGLSFSTLQTGAF